MTPKVPSVVTRLRLRLAHRLHPYWTQTEIDAANWRGHERWLALGFGVKHHVNEPCPVTAKDGSV